MGSMSGNSPEGKHQLDLTTALRILRNAGKEDPRLCTDDPDAQIQGIIDALCDLSIHDGMTGLVNATFFHAVLTREIDRSLRTGKTCGLMVLDIDYFKRINDTYGHGTGDKVIQAFASNMMLNMRSMDTAARIGGEEFAVILPECGPEDAIHAATRIHHTLNPLLLTLDGHELQVTCSVGLVWTDPSYAASSAEMVAEADREMYRAKHLGRARLCHPPIESTLISQKERSDLMAMMFEGIQYER
jgi:diguanylate cyclase (GGDEF)-like protein